MLCFYKENIYEMAKCYTNVITQVLNESQNDISKLHKFFSFFSFNLKFYLFILYGQHPQRIILIHNRLHIGFDPSCHHPIHIYTPTYNIHYQKGKVNHIIVYKRRWRVRKRIQCLSGLTDLQLNISIMKLMVMIYEIVLFLI